MSHAFVSYVRENQAEVTILVRELGLAGVHTWFDRDSLAVGDRWPEVIESSIKSGGFFIACFSKEYADRQETYMEQELDVARRVLLQQVDGRTWFIPVLLDRSTPEDVRLTSDAVLGSIHSVSMWPDWREGFRRILEVVSPERSFGRCLNKTPVIRPDPVATAPLLALDFGTSHCVLSYRNAQRKWIAIRDKDGRTLHPSVVTFADDWDYWVGMEAVEASEHRPERAVHGIKRMLARGQEARIGHKKFDAGTLASLVIRHLKDCAEHVLGTPVDQVIVSAPAEYAFSQRKALVRACNLAGFKVRELVAEPNAVALTYSEWLQQARLEIFAETSEFCGLLLLAIDIGGGTTDVTLGAIGGSGESVDFQALLTVGDNELGGMDYDAAVLRCLREIVDDSVARQHLRWTAVDDCKLLRHARQVKEALARSDSYEIVIPDLENRFGQLEPLVVRIDRAPIAAAFRPLDARVSNLIDKVLELEELRTEGGESHIIRFVVLAGQGTKLWTIADLVRRRFAAVELETQFQENAVSLGLSIWASIREGFRHDLFLYHVITHGIGFRYLRQVVPPELGVTLGVHEISLVSSANQDIYTIIKPNKMIPRRLHANVQVRGPGRLQFELLEIDSDERPIGLYATLTAELADRSYAFELEIEVTPTDGRTFRLLDSGSNVLQEVTVDILSP